MAETQHQRGGRVRLQNTAQQLLQTRLCIVLLFWFKTDFRSDLRAMNCEIFLEENGPRLPRYYVVTHAFSPLNLKCLPLPLLSASECLSHRDAITRYCFSFR